MKKININNFIFPASAGGRKQRMQIESDILSLLDNLDMITASAAAIMLSETKAIAQSPYLNEIINIDINNVLLQFLTDSFHADDINDIDDLFDSKYYKNVIKKYFGKITSFIRGGVADVLPKQNMRFFARISMAAKQTNIYIDKICNTLYTFESVKYKSALSESTIMSSPAKKYKLDHLSNNYRDALIYIVDFLLTCTCISKMLFVERMIRKMPADSEFIKIVDNTVNSLDSLKLIIDKTKPIYEQYYRTQLGNIRGDNLLYGMAITIMVNKIKRTEIKNIDILKLDYKPAGYDDLNQNMMMWLDLLAKYNYPGDIGTLILQRLTYIIKNDYDLLLYAFGELLGWEEFYKKRVEYYIRERDKERYLKGDFNKEIQEISGYSQIAEIFEK